MRYVEKIYPLHIARWFCLCLAMFLTGAASAQSSGSYPNKPVRIIIPFAPGGAPSVVTRILTDKFSKDLGQSYVIDNRGGGDTVIGTAAVAKAAPDGYTLLVTTSTYIVNYWLTPDLPFDSLKELTPVSALTRGDLVLAFHPSFPARNMKEYMDYAKANPGKINMSYAGSIGLLNYQLLMNATGTRFLPLSYKGGTEAVTDLVSGTVDGNLTGVTNVDSFIKAGKLKALAITGSKRNPVLPDVPTFSEAGVKDFDAYNWFALFAPSKTPRDIVEKANLQVRKAQEAPEVISSLVKLGLDPYPTTVIQAEAFIRTEVDRLGRLIKESGLKPGAN